MEGEPGVVVVRGRAGPVGKRQGEVEHVWPYRHRAPRHRVAEDGAAQVGRGPAAFAVPHRVGEHRAIAVDEPQVAVHGRHLRAECGRRRGEALRVPHVVLVGHGHGIHALPGHVLEGLAEGADRAEVDRRPVQHEAVVTVEQRPGALERLLARRVIDDVRLPAHALLRPHRLHLLAQVALVGLVDRHRHAHPHHGHSAVARLSRRCPLGSPATPSTSGAARCRASRQCGRGAIPAAAHMSCDSTL